MNAAKTDVFQHIDVTDGRIWLKPSVEELASVIGHADRVAPLEAYCMALQERRADGGGDGTSSVVADPRPPRAAAIEGRGFDRIT